MSLSDFLSLAILPNKNLFKTEALSARVPSVPTASERASAISPLFVSLDLPIKFSIFLSSFS